jgi:hypothetical protein
MSYPAAPFRHLQRLTDHIGLLEHAEGIVPRHDHGYCVDDVARGLVVVCRGAVAIRGTRHPGTQLARAGPGTLTELE